MKAFRVATFVAVIAIATCARVPCDWAQILGVNTAGADAAAVEAPPLPVHTIEGVGGGGITPMAYLVNAGDEEHVFGPLAASLSYINLGQKNLEVVGR
ncbi:MAG: hypothetical protein ACYC3X_07620 [Pirellulaceae bacterium]